MQMQKPNLEFAQMMEDYHSRKSWIDCYLTMAMCCQFIAIILLGGLTSIMISIASANCDVNDCEGSGIDDEAQEGAAIAAMTNIPVIA